MRQQSQERRIPATEAETRSSPPRLSARARKRRDRRDRRGDARDLKFRVLALAHGHLHALRASVISQIGIGFPMASDQVVIVPRIAESSAGALKMTPSNPPPQAN
jgi:hypothetical protein